jgi:uncharacterized delta-60 repeat protein
MRRERQWLSGSGLLRGWIAALTMVLLATPGVRAVASDPSRDLTFGSGSRLFDIRHTDDISGDILTLPDGRMILGGTSARPASSTQRDVVVVQRLASGFNDPSFGGGDGMVLIDLNPASLRDLALAPDGKIVGLAATASDSFLFRLNTDGTLDTDTDSVPSSHFDHDGIAHLNFGNHSEFWNRIAVAADGSVVAVGNVTPTVSDSPVAAVARFTPLGVADTSFDGDGLRTVSLGTALSSGQDIGIDPNTGRIVITSTARGGASFQPAVAVARLLPADGALDNSFSGDGKVLVLLDQDGGAPIAMVVQPNGKIVIAARHDIQTNAVDRPMFLRFTSGGVLDSTFASGGILESTATDSLDPRTLLAAGGGSLVSTATGFGGLGVMRITSGGVLDSTFGTGGVVRQGGPGDGSSIKAALTTGGSILLLGEATLGAAASDLFVLKLTSSGAPDDTFAAGVKAQLHDFGNGTAANAVAVAGSGRILLAGGRQTDSGRDFVIRGVLPNGYSDPTFGFNGETAVDFGTTSEEAFAVAPAGGGQVVAAGCADCDGIAPDFAVARFDADGQPDGSFGTDGLVRLTFGTNLAENATAVAVQGNGKVVVAGSVSGDFAVARLTTTGLPDNSFSGDGKVRTDITSGSGDGAADVVIQGDGKILVAGTRAVGGSTRFAIVRYTSGGVLDTTFSGDGKQVLAVGPNNSEATSIMVRPDGKIVIVGKAFGGAQAEIAIVRLLSNGAPDTTFSGDGRATIPIGSVDAIVADAALATGNKVVVGGFNGNGDLMIVRLTAAGALDTTFGGDGAEETQLFGAADGRSVAIQPSDGRILLAGESPNRLGIEEMALVRYNP